MASTLLPLLFAELATRPASVAADKLALYMRAGQLRVLKPAEVERDLVLGRTLEAYQVFASFKNKITATDTVLSAIAKLDARELTAARLLTLLKAGPGLRINLTPDKTQVLIELSNVPSPDLYIDYVQSGYVLADYILPEPK